MSLKVRRLVTGHDKSATIHTWINRGSEPCVIAFVLVGANPVTAGGGKLHATG